MLFSDPKYLGTARTVCVHADRKCTLALGLKGMPGPCHSLDLSPFLPSMTASAGIPVVQGAAGFPRPPAYCTRSYCWELGLWALKLTNHCAQLPSTSWCSHHAPGQGLHGQVLSWSSAVLGEVDNPACRALWSWPKKSQEAHTPQVSLQCLPTAQLQVM